MDKTKGVKEYIEEYGEVPFRPSIDELTIMSLDGVVDAIDGCSVEPDGRCPHGYRSWLLELRYI